MQGYKQSKAYIIAEGPMESTTRNMWKVVYDRKCGAVVMLSDIMENGKVCLGVYNVTFLLFACLCTFLRRVVTSIGHLLLEN